MDNIRGSFLMVLAMLGFAVEDMFIKQMTGALPVGQIILIVGLGGAIIFAAIGALRGEAIWSRDMLHPAILARTAGEMIGSVAFVTALSRIDITVAAAILQATPLVVTAGAALFLGESVGWKRWVAITVGFVGVLLVLRPGLEGFEPNALWAVVAVFGLGGRDLLTRAVPATVSSIQISTYSLMALVGDRFVVPGNADGFRLIAAVFTGVAAYYAIVAATRVGDVSVVSPFRYTRMVFALIIGLLVFAERPDVLTLLGAAIIIGSGVFSIWREARLRRASPLDQAAL